jgi:hypothetical protein
MRPSRIGWPQRISSLGAPRRDPGCQAENPVKVTSCALGVKRPSAWAKTDLETDTSNQVCRHLCTGSHSIHRDRTHDPHFVYTLDAAGRHIDSRTRSGWRSMLVGDGHG